MSPGTIIGLRDVSVVLAGRPVLRRVDLAVHPGEVVAVLGANGSGKSTLVRAMLGLVPAARGELALFDVPLPAFREWHRIGYVPQRISATAGVPASVWEVVASGRLPRRPFLRPLRKSDRTAIREAIEAVGLTERTHEGCATLSGGQQQRVLLARALAGEPELFVLDEPTAGVDVVTQRAFADALKVLIEKGTTIVLVAHELGPIAPMIARTVVMRDGRVAYDGPPTAHESDHEHGHHHPDLGRLTGDHAPVVTSPIDRPTAGSGR